MGEAFITDKQKDRFARDSGIYNDYNQLLLLSPKSKTEMMKFLADKYGMKDICTVYRALKRFKAENL